MYDNTTRSYTLKDASGSYAWIVENMQRSDVASMTDDELTAWVNDLIDDAKGYDLEKIEDAAPAQTYPRYGYSTADVLNDEDEYLAYWRGWVERDYADESPQVVAWLKAWAIADED